MKKANLILFAFLFGIFFLSAPIAWSQTKTDVTPVFEQQPSIVLDLWINGGKWKYKDYVKLTNATLHQNISLNVYACDPKGGKWVLIGPAKLKNFCDFDTIDSLWKGRMNEFRWLAIHSLDNINIDAQTVLNRNDILITIFENTTTEKPQLIDNAPLFDMQPSVVMDLWENGNKGKYKDNVSLTNQSQNKNLSFNIYGYDKKNNQWIIIGPKKISNTDRIHSPWELLANLSDTVNTPWKGKLNEFRWFAIHSLDGIEFNAQGMANRNDVVIMIIDK